MTSEELQVTEQYIQAFAEPLHPVESGPTTYMEDTKTQILPIPTEEVAPELFQLIESDSVPEPTLSMAETILNWRDEVLAEPQPSWQLVHPHTWFKQSVERLIGKL